MNWLLKQLHKYRIGYCIFVVVLNSLYMFCNENKINNMKQNGCFEKLMEKQVLLWDACLWLDKAEGGKIGRDVKKSEEVRLRGKGFTVTIGSLEAQILTCWSHSLSLPSSLYVCVMCVCWVRVCAEWVCVLSECVCVCSGLKFILTTKAWSSCTNPMLILT